MNAKNEEGETALIYSSKWSNCKYSYLEKNVKTICYETNENKLISNAGNLEVAKILVEKGADIEATDNYGWDALHWSSACGK